VESFADFYKFSLTDYEQLVFVPNDGCGSCIREGKNYINENIDNPKILCIYVSRFHGELAPHKDRPNFLLDRQMKAMDFGVVSTGAVIYQVDGDSLYMIIPK